MPDSSVQMAKQPDRIVSGYYWLFPSEILTHLCFKTTFQQVTPLGHKPRLEAQARPCTGWYVDSWSAWTVWSSPGELSTRRCWAPLSRSDFPNQALTTFLFIRHLEMEQTAIAIATDNMAIAVSLADTVQRSKQEISEFFDITDGGEITWFLNFKFCHDWASCTISIHQQSYIEVTATKFSQQNSKLVYLPMLLGVFFLDDQCLVTPMAHHSVQIFVRYVDNTMTLYYLRCPSGRPPDYT